MIFLAAGAVCALLYVLFRLRDRRMLRNGALLLGGMFFIVLGVVNLLAERLPVIEVLIVGAILLFPVGVLVLAGFLTANGVRMFRSEGRSVGNLLSLLAGIGLIAVLLLLVLLARAHPVR